MRRSNARERWENRGEEVGSEAYECFRETFWSLLLGLDMEIERYYSCCDPMRFSIRDCVTMRIIPPPFVSHAPLEPVVELFESFLCQCSAFDPCPLLR